MKKKTLIASMLVALVAISAVGYALTILNVVVVNVNDCVETDNGLDYFNKGYISGYFYTGNWSANMTFWDTCLGYFTLVEGVCGGTISQNYSHLAAAVTVNCTSANGSQSTCYNGACLS
jgi:hypothetical protein